LDALTFPYAADLDGIRRLLNTRIEVDSALTGLRSRIEARARQVEEEKHKPPTSVPGSESGGGESGGTGDGGVEPPKSTPVVVRARRSYASPAELQQLITELQTALATGQPVNLEFD
jgi:hypothetical protein